MKKICKGDNVFVIYGKYKGKSGKIIKVTKKNGLIIKNINKFKKHVKSNSNVNSSGGIIEKLMPIDISNVCIKNEKTKKKDKVKIINKKGKKIRFYKSDLSKVK